MIPIWLQFAIVALSFVIYRKLSRRKFVQLIERIPGPKSYPIVGSCLPFIFTPNNQKLNLTLNFHKRFGPLYKIWLGSNASVHIVRPEDVEVILSSRQNISKAFGYNFFEPWLGTGLLTSSGSKWMIRRKMLTPAFHFTILQTFFEVFVENSNVFVSKLKKEIKSHGFDVFPYIKNCTLDIICETAMGVKVNAQEKPSDYTQSVEAINELIHERIYRPWLWSNLLHMLSDHYKRQQMAINVLHGMSLKVIRERKLQRSKAKEDGNSNSNSFDIGRKNKKMFLDLLLDISEELSVGKLSESDIREEVDTFMFEGHDTTSAAVAWTLYLLGRHPEIQDKVFEELTAVFNSPDEIATLKSISELKYLECVLKESLRLFPSVPFIARTLTEDCNMSGHQIPRGTTVRINIYQLHRQPDHFPNPDQFDPTRFLPQNIQNRHPFVYVPFSAGSRNCIGQKFAMLEEKVILSTFLRKYKVASHQKYEDLKLIIDSVIRPEDGILIDITERVYSQERVKPN